MKKKLINAYMEATYVFAKLSYCKRKQVGCMFVKDDRIISIGYNGSPSGWDNNCESEDGSTFAHILHAEENALIKLTRSHESSEGAVVFITLAPCLPCAKMLAELKLEHIYYAEKYEGRSEEGIEHLRARGIPIEQTK